MTSTKRPTSAFVLAAGKGERMRPLTEKHPKPLVSVGGKPLIDQVLDRLWAAGVAEAVVNVHYLADQIEDHLRSRKNPKITISDERGALLDTGGGVAKALPKLGRDPFLIHNSDSIWIEGMGSNLDRLIDAWDETTMDSLMLVAPIATSIGYDGPGDFQMDTTGRLTRQSGARLAPFVFAGVSIAHPRLFDGAPKGPFSLNKLWNGAIEKGRLYGMRLEGIWMHVGTPNAIAEAENAIANSMTAGATLPGED
ncbi:nucleotidyl transferase [Hyphomicrobium denitrificans 1NES1]|uniref:Nucleotidyl transferase n=1 Tax=Hyphomicrobium denitrificans 1NES1 TaxID=670307 RepID=N0B4Z2_9HYPH|nr:nucleotidyltransferase family protein [Hyphomicrobium denitrificans]AGK58574.1 nucleotidyl transferase [Hyphomicrobium denitrificans 1NES1]